jgi:hypothetical protein
MFSYDILFDRIALPEPAQKAFFDVKDKIEPVIEDIRRIFFRGGQIDGIVSELAGPGDNIDIIWFAVCVMLS